MRLEFKRRIDFYFGGIFVFLLALPVRLLGLLLRKEHHLDSPRHIVFVKILGGGSLLMALPAILAIRQRHPRCKISIVCNPGVQEVAKICGCFDEVIAIEDRRLISLAACSLRALLRLIWRCDVIVDLEAHSRLTTIFAALTMAPSRIGFVTHDSLWRSRLYTHSIYYNLFSGVYAFSDAIAIFFGIHAVNIAVVVKHMSERIHAADAPAKTADLGGEYAVVGVGCSEFVKERQLDAVYWRELLSRLHQRFPDMRFVFLGSREDLELAAAASENSKNSINLCGQTSLPESLRILAQADAFIGVDSLLMHFARMLCPRIVSLWGPTLPETRLRPMPAAEYRACEYYACSPCAHVMTSPPCRGQNECMRRHNLDKIVQFFDENKNPKTASPAPYTVGVWVAFPSDRRPLYKTVQVIYE